MTKMFVIVDEVDNVMYDNIFYVARLAESYPGAESLQPFYYCLWTKFQIILSKIFIYDKSFYWIRGNLFQDSQSGKFNVTFMPPSRD